MSTKSSKKAKIQLSTLDAAEFEDLHREELERSPEYASGYAMRQAVIEAGEKAVLSAGEMIREERLARGLKQVELAERSGIAQSEISDIERGVGRYGPSAATLGRLCAALEGELNWSARAGPKTHDLAITAEQSASVLQAISAGSIAHSVTISSMLAASAAAAEFPGEMTISMELNESVVSAVQLQDVAVEGSTTRRPVRRRATAGSSGTDTKR